MRMERKISLALLFAIFVQSAGALVWAGGAGERLSALERGAETDRPVSERLARVEAELEAVRAQLNRIERKVETRRGEN